MPQPRPSRPTFSAHAAPVDRPLPLWILYPLFFIAVYLAHYSLLHLPYFWDEVGYYIPAALDFFHTGSLIPRTTLTNAHPPLPSILLAAWWRTCGLSIGGTRTLICMVSAAGLLGAFRLARLLTGPVLATVITLLTAIYPVWFAQSTLAQADIFAAAFSLWALSYYFETPTTRSFTLLATLFSLASLSKETAIITPLALALWELVQLLTREPSARKSRLLALLTPILPLCVWYAFHLHKTGYIFGNPEFVRYNATANLSLVRVLASLWHRFVHLFLHMNMYVPVVATLAVLWMPRLVAPTRALSRPVLTAVSVILAGNAIAFSILGGALLTRYLLPMFPLGLLVCVALWHTRGKIILPIAALTAAAFLLGLWFNPPYSFAPEDNLTYADMIQLHRQAIGIITKQFPYATTLTVFPATLEMQRPELGYTLTPLKVVALDNFSAAQIERAAEDPGAFDTMLIFSTKWVPPAGSLNLGRNSEQTDSKYFDFHHDLSPQAAAQALQGEVVWRARRNGEWAAILRFPRSSLARNTRNWQTGP